MSILSLNEGSQVIWDNPLTNHRSDNRVINQTLNAIDRILFPHREENKVSHTIKRIYWERCGRPQGDSDWSTHHIHRNPHILSMAIKDRMEFEVLQLSDDERNRLYERIDLLSNPSRLGPNWGNTHRLDNLAVFYEAFIPHDAPDKERLNKIATAYAQAVSKALMEVDDGGIDAVHIDQNPLCQIDGSWRQLIEGREGDHAIFGYKKANEFRDDDDDNFGLQTHIEIELRSIEPEQPVAQDTTSSLEQVLAKIQNLELPDTIKDDLIQDIQNLQPQEEDCVICLDSPRTYAAIPCGHRSYCQECITEIFQTTHSCSICREDIKAIQKVIP